MHVSSSTSFPASASFLGLWPCILRGLPGQVKREDLLRYDLVCCLLPSYHSAGDRSLLAPLEEPAVLGSPGYRPAASGNGRIGLWQKVQPQLIKGGPP